MLHIGIECHNLEQSRAGVARSLAELFLALSKMPRLQERARFILYFHKAIPPDPYLSSPLFACKVLPSPIGRPSFTLFYNYLLPRALARDHIDIAFFPSYMLPLRLRTPAVIEIHDVAYEAHPEWFHPLKRRHQYRLLSRHGAKHARRVVTISHFSQSEIIKYYRIPTEKIDVAYLGVNPRFSPVRDEAKERSVRQKYRLHGSFFLWVGQMLTRRHVPEALEGFRRVVRKHPSLQFFVSGRNLIYPARDVDEAVRAINNECGREAVTRVPYVEDDELPHLYRASTALVWMTSYEGMGLPILESLACGTPVITMRYGASEELFGDAAFFVEYPEHPEEVAAAMERALTDTAERHRIREAGIQLPSRFTWETYAQKIVEILETATRN